MIRSESLDRLIEYSVAVKMLKAAPDGGREKTVVDLGCGQGYFPLLLASKGYKVVCIDIAKEAAMQQKQYYDKFRHMVSGTVHPIIASATAIPIRQSGVNVTAISTIEHIEDDVSVFREIGQLLGDEGRAVVSFAYSPHPLGSEEQAKRWKLYREHHPTYGPFNIAEKISGPSRCSITDSLFFRGGWLFELISKRSAAAAFVIMDSLAGVPLAMLSTLSKSDDDNRERGWVFTLEPGPSVAGSRNTPVP